MSEQRATIAARTASGYRDLEPIRLDRLENPYGPSVAVLEVMTSVRRWEDARDRPSLPILRRRLAELAGVPPTWILLGNGIDELLDAIFHHQRERGPLVLFPPAGPEHERRAAVHRLTVIRLQRTARFAIELDLETVADLPADSWALVESPNDPTGTLLDPLDAVRLARASDLLVIDERHGAYSGRSMVPLVREFDNMIVLQTLETWASLSSFPIAYAIGPPALISQLDAFRARDEITTGAILAARATLEDLPYVKLTLQRVRLERSRLFRTLRKLNMVSPRPSWANFLPMRVERGDVSTIVDGLAERGIWVFQPPHPELRQVLRVSAGRPEHTDALKRALIEIGLYL